MTTMTMLARDVEQAGQVAAGLATLVIGDELAARSPDRDGSQFLKVTNVPGMLCQVSVAADGLVEWEIRPCEGHRQGPA